MIHPAFTANIIIFLSLKCNLTCHDRDLSENNAHHHGTPWIESHVHLGYGHTCTVLSVLLNGLYLEKDVLLPDQSNWDNWGYMKA